MLVAQLYDSGAYFMFILDQGNDIRQKVNSNNFLIKSSKWVIRQQKQLATSTMHLAQELLMNIQCSGGSRSFAKEMRALKMRNTVAGHRKLTVTNWEDHWSSSSYNYMRSYRRTQCRPFVGRSAFEAEKKKKQQKKPCIIQHSFPHQRRI